MPPVPAPTTTQPGMGVIFPLHLAEDRLCDVVVSAPVRGALGIGELVHVVAAQFRGELGAFRIHRSRVVDEVGLAPLEGNLLDLLG